MAAEANLQRRVMRYLDAHDGVYFLKNHGSEYTRRGVADLHICYRGHFIAVELKAPGEKPTKQQLAEMLAVTQSGGWAGYCDSWEGWLGTWALATATVARNES